MAMYTARRCAASRWARVLAIGVLGFATGSVAQADTFASAPMRTVGPSVSGQGAPAPGGGWQVSDDRQIGPSLVGQGGWTGSCSDTRFDQEIAIDGVYGSGQAWRLSNWYHNGCVNHITSPTFAPAGEAGSRTLSGGGIGPATNAVIYEFWFRSAATTPQPGTFVSTTISDAPGRRMTYLGFFDEFPGDVDSGCANPATGCFHVVANEITNGDADGDNVPNDPDGDVTFASHVSPDLTRGAWYRARISAVFVDGKLNDQIRYDLFNATGTPVWSTGPINSWEDAYLEAQYGAPVGDKVASSHIAFRISADPDSGTQANGHTYSVANRPRGIVFDEVSVTPAAGTGIATSFEADRYVSASGGSDDSNCAVQLDPCLTLQFAVGQADAGDTIHVASGTYGAAALIGTTKNGLRIVGEGATRPILTRLGGPTNQSLIDIDGARNVTIENLQLLVDRSYVAEGVLCRNGCTGLRVINNEFRQRRTVADPGPQSSYGRTNAISVNGGSPATPARITVQGNLIASDSSSPIPTRFRAGVALDYGYGVIGGSMAAEQNDITALNHDVIVRQAAGGDVLIDGNTLRGFGIQIAAPDVIAGSIQILNNLFLPATEPAAPAAAGDFSAMRLISNPNVKPVLVQGNVFAGHERGVLVENFPGVTLDNNDFTPRAGSSSFVHLVLSNKELFTGSPPQPIALALAITATRNQFNAGTVANTGAAVELLNDNAQTAPPGGYYGALTFGGAGVENDFAAGLRYYFRLDDYTCANSNDSCPPLTALYVATLGPNIAQGSPVAPFAQNFSGVGNRYGNFLPTGMNTAQKSALIARTYDDRINPALGLVNYGFTSTSIISASPSPSVVGQAIDVRVLVTSEAGSPLSGVVTVRDTSSNNVLCTIPNYPTSDTCTTAGYAAAGNYQISACYSDGVYVDTCGVRQHIVRYAPGSSVVVVPAPLPNAQDNDYTRINIAMQLVNTNVTITLDGQFDWSPNGSRAAGSNPDPSSFAYASWQRGTDGIAATDDDWSIEPLRNINGVTVTAAVPDANSTPDDPTDDVYDGRIVGPGDDGAANLEGVFSLYNGAYRGWTFSNVDYAGFDLALGMFNTGAPGDAYSNVTVSNNRFQVPADRSNIAGGDVSQNIGLHFSFGLNQDIARNRFVMNATGENVGNSASSVVMQSNTSGNALYDGLRIRDNVIAIVGQQGAVATRMLGIWENDNAYMGTDVRIERNLLRNAATAFGGGPALVNDYTGIRYTSGSGGGKTVRIQGNRIEGLNVGIATLFSATIAYNPPATIGAVQIVGNTIIGAGSIGVRIASNNGNANANLAFNRLVGNAIAVSNFTGTLGANTGVLNAGRVIAEDNWWGCNAGPGANAPGCAQAANPVSAGVTVTDWLKLALRSDGGATSGTPEPFDAVLSDDVLTVNPGMANYPATDIAFVTSLGSVTTPVALSTGVAANTLVTSAPEDQGGALIAASHDNQTVTRFVRVCTTAAPCTFVIPSTTASGDTPSAVDNDYTRINNALQVALAGDVIELQGDFNWTQTLARASWALGSDGVGGNDDDWSAKLPAGVNDVTLRAASLGAASVRGDQGIASTDTAIFVTAFGGPNQKWTFENLTLRGFDFAFGLFASGSEDFNGTAFGNNLIEIPADGVDNFGNYGIYTGYGSAQSLIGNTITIDISGSDGRPLVDGGTNSRYVGIQIGDSCNVDCFDGLIVDGNTVEVNGVPAVAPALPPRVIGIWENAGDGNSAITIEDNTVVGSGSVGAVGVESNRQFGLIASTQTNGTKQAVVRGNHVSGVATGFTGQLPIYGHFVTTDSPLLVEGNTFVANGTALHLAGAYSNQVGSNFAKYTLRYNRIAGNVIGLRAERADDVPLPGDPGYGGDERPSQIAANDNWWGCNEGPAGPDCDPVVIDAGADSAIVVLDTWLTLSLTPDSNIAPQGGSVGLSSSVNTNSANANVAATTQFPAGTAIHFAHVGAVNSILSPTDPLTGAVPGNAVIGAVRSELSGLLATQIVSATLDAETVQATVTVIPPPLTSFVIDGSGTFAGNAGSALATLPMARALDSNGTGVAGVTVLFEITAGGGSGTVLQAVTNATGRASPGSWILGRNAGVNTMTARVPNTALPTLGFTANGAEVAGVSLVKSSATTQAQPGNAITYSIVVSHAAGPSNAAAVDILDALPVGLDVATATWSCAGTTNAANDTATCGVTNGAGDVDVTVALPVGTSVTVTLTATVEADATIGPMVNSAMAILTSSTDPDTSNNEDDHSVNITPLPAPVDEIFRDGFEQVVLVNSPQSLSM